MSNLRKLTLLHSNDMHGDFMAEEKDERLVGGVSLLSGYLDKVRQEEDNVLYAIAGDMFRGSVIDTEYKGVSTIQLMNMLAPDVVTIGNHEIDYGIAHLLFLEKCADFPIINANLYLKMNHKRLFQPCRVIEIDGMKILFIGILTEMTIAEFKKDNLIGTFITLEDAAKEVGRICNTYNSIDIDCTVLLTHIGFEEDKQLASLLDPAWGVDLIIGGHSHTFLTEPAIVNGIPIVQAGTGTDQIGRFDLLIDIEKDCLCDYSWRAVPINDETCPRDPDMEELLSAYKSQTDAKYGKILTKFVRPLHHPSRHQETELGDLFSDILRDALGVEIFLLASGSIRSESLGPIVTKGDFDMCFPFDDSAHLLYWTGSQLRRAFLRMLRDEALSGHHTEFYQMSSGLTVEYDQEKKEITTFLFHGEPIADDRVFMMGLQHYHFLNMKDSFDLDLEEVERNGAIRIIASSCKDVIEEKLEEGLHQNVTEMHRLTVHRSGTREE